MSKCQEINDNFASALEIFKQEDLIGQCQRKKLPNGKCLDSYIHLVRFNYQSSIALEEMSHNIQSFDDFRNIGRCFELQRNFSNILQDLRYKSDD